MEYNKRFVIDGSTWMHHFQAMAKGEMDGRKKFYRLKSKHSKPVLNQESVKVVAESEQTGASQERVERREQAKKAQHFHH